jgi:hypothetical protein
VNGHVTAAAVYNHLLNLPAAAHTAGCTAVHKTCWACVSSPQPEPRRTDSQACSGTFAVGLHVTQSSQQLLCRAATAPAAAAAIACCCIAAHLSVTMSSTAPSVEVWLKVRAARPSSSSHTNLRSPRQGGQVVIQKKVSRHID